MENKLLFLAVVATTLFTSCSVSKTTTTKTMDIYGAGVIQNPVIVDLDVKEVKVVGVAKASSPTDALEDVKQDAIIDALKKADADVLVEPSFVTISYGGKKEVTVTGFPAKYKNFRSLKVEDLQLIQLSISQKANVTETPKGKTKLTGPFTKE